MHTNANVFFFFFSFFFLFSFSLFFDKVSKTAVISLASLNLTKKLYEDVQLELLPAQIKFHADQSKSVRENEVKRVCFVLAL